MTLELTITALSHAGEGIGKHNGRTVFVPYALPGEVVRVSLIEEKKNFARARLIEIVTPASERVAPPCPHYFTPTASPNSVCGGCQLQHLTYEAQLAFKQRAVSEQLTRVGGLTNPPVRAPLPAPEPFGYRNHVQMVFTEQGQLGFRAAQSHTVVPITECRLLHPALAHLWPRITLAPEALPAVQRLTLRVGAEDDTLIIFEAPDDAPEVELDLPVSAALLRPDGASLALAGRDYVLEVVRGRTFKISAGSFFQVNTAQAATLVQLVLDGLALRGGETVLDLYCGVGLFSAFIAPIAGRVVGVEAFAPAVADLVENLDEFENVAVYEAAVEVALPELALTADAIVLDPPRAGCTPEALEAFVGCGATRIVYVSCDPATLARDAKRLSAHGYTLTSVQPVDMFPQTHHIECVAVFQRAQT